MFIDPIRDAFLGFYTVSLSEQASDAVRARRQLQLLQAVADSEALVRTPVILVCDSHAVTEILQQQGLPMWEKVIALKKIPARCQPAKFR